MTKGLTGGISISSYSPIKFIAEPGESAIPQLGQSVGLWSSKPSGLSASRRLCWLMPGLRATGTGVLPPFLPVRRGRLRRSPRRLVRPLELENQLDQLLTAHALQISPIHPDMDSEIANQGKGVGCLIVPRPSRYFSYLSSSAAYSAR